MLRKINLLIFTLIIVSCLTQKDNFLFETKSLIIHPDTIACDSINYLEFVIPILNFDSTSIYSCIIGEFDTVEFENRIELMPISSYDSIPDRFIKDSSFIITYRRENMTRTKIGFVRIENKKNNKYSIFRLSKK